MDKRIEIIEKILSTMPTTYDTYSSEEEAEQADPLREKEIADLSNIPEIAQEIVGQLDQLVSDDFCGHCVDCIHLNDDKEYPGCTEPKVSEMMLDETGYNTIYDIKEFGCRKFESKNSR